MKFMIRTLIVTLFTVFTVASAKIKDNVYDTLPLLPHQKANPDATGWVVLTNSNIFAEPSDSSKKLYMAAAGDNIQVAQLTDDNLWYKVSYKDKAGYILATNLGQVYNNPTPLNPQKSVELQNNCSYQLTDMEYQPIIDEVAGFWVYSMKLKCFDSILKMRIMLSQLTMPKICQSCHMVELEIFNYVDGKGQSHRLDLIYNRKTKRLKWFGTNNPKFPQVPAGEELQANNINEILSATSNEFISLVGKDGFHEIIKEIEGIPEE